MPPSVRMAEWVGCRVKGWCSGELHADIQWGEVTGDWLKRGKKQSRT